MRRASKYLSNSRPSKTTSKVRQSQVTSLRQEVERDLALMERDGISTKRPQKRSECPSERPCPYVSCRHHLYLEITEAGSIKFNFDDMPLEAMAETCALDVAENHREGIQLQKVGEYLNLTRERVRQIESEAKIKLAENLKLDEEKTDFLIETIKKLSQERDDGDK